MYIYVLYLFPCCCKPPPIRRGRGIPTTRRQSSGPMARPSPSSRDLGKAMSHSTMLNKIRGSSSTSPQQSREFQLPSDRRSSSGTNNDGSSRILDDSTPTITGSGSSIPPPTASSNNDDVDDVEMNQASKAKSSTKHKRTESFQFKFIDDVDDDDED